MEETFSLQKRNEVTAIDKSNPIIKNIQRNRKINFIDMDITKKLYSIGKFDYIYARFFCMQ